MPNNVNAVLEGGSSVEREREVMPIIENNSIIISFGDQNQD